MPRAGSGGSSGGHSSGSHSSSRSGGGHHVSSGGSSSHSRAGSGSSFSSSRSSFGGSRSSTPNMGGMGFGGGYRSNPMPPPPPPPRQNYYHNTTVYNNAPYPSGGYYPQTPHPPRQKRGGCLGTIVTALVAFFMVLVIVGLLAGSDEPTNSRNREKVNTGVAFQNECIVDELGWFENIPKTERRLQNFYDQTGIQPYIVLHAYDSSLQTDEDKEAYANEYYENNIDNEGTFLFVYFAEQNQDDDVGYMCYVNGKQITSVMDAEAIDIFWAYVDNKWYSDMSTDDMFVSIFDSTAKTIMTKSATKEDVGVKFGIVAIIIAGTAAVVIILKVRRKHEHEKAEETERILNAPIDGLGGKSSDPLADKYTNTKT